MEVAGGLGVWPRRCVPHGGRAVAAARAIVNGFTVGDFFQVQEGVAHTHTSLLPNGVTSPQNSSNLLTFKPQIVSPPAPPRRFAGRDENLGLSFLTTRRTARRAQRCLPAFLLNPPLTTERSRGRDAARERRRR